MTICITGNLRLIEDISNPEKIQPWPNALIRVCKHNNTNIVFASGFSDIWGKFRICGIPWDEVLDIYAGDIEGKSGDICTGSVLGIKINDKNAKNMIAKIHAGSTNPMKTDWLQLLERGGNRRIAITTSVDTTEAGFGSTPIYVTSLGGDGYHDDVTGVTSIYFPTSKSFKIYLRKRDGSDLGKDIAKNYHWIINWIGIEKFYGIEIDILGTCYSV